MTTRDVIVFVPLVPAMPVIATWWLPWERWLPKYVPKKILGPYLLYASFAAWYFAMPWWVVLIALVFGAVLSVIAIVEIMQDKEEKASSLSGQ
jgi:RsiW-degrading membrane proteinase PrsW (M82 family)